MTLPIITLGGARGERRRPRSYIASEARSTVRGPVLARHFTHETGGRLGLPKAWAGFRGLDDGYDPAPSVERSVRPHGEPSEIHRLRQSRANSSSATRNAAPNSPALSPSGEVLMRRSRVAKAIERPYTVRRSSPRKASSAALICPPMTMSEGL